MGGQYAWLAACACRGLSAVAPFYGMLRYEPGLDAKRKPRAPLDAVADLSCPALGLYGREDALIPNADVDELELRLARQRQPFEIVRYAGAGHAFLNDTRPAMYRPEAATDAWRRLLAFLRARLPVGGVTKGTVLFRHERASTRARVRERVAKRVMVASTARGRPPLSWRAAAEAARLGAFADGVELRPPALARGLGHVGHRVGAEQTVARGAEQRAGRRVRVGDRARLDVDREEGVAHAIDRGGHHAPLAGHRRPARAARPRGLAQRQQEALDERGERRAQRRRVRAGLVRRRVEPRLEHAPRAPLAGAQPLERGRGGLVLHEREQQEGAEAAQRLGLGGAVGRERSLAAASHGRFDGSASRQEPAGECTSPAHARESREHGARARGRCRSVAGGAARRLNPPAARADTARHAP